MDDSAVKTLRQQIKGEVITPESPEYEASSNVINRTGHPGVIVRPTTNDEVATALAFAHQHDLVLSVRCGGHWGPGLGTNDGGMVVDLAHFSDISVLDEQQYLVRVGGGAHWGDVAKYLDTYGLAISSGDTNSVGVGGLTLGGGIGWQVRKYGLAIDQLVAAELVTADGQTIRTSQTEHPDLFWAIRGGGGNFGIVTHFEFRAHPLKFIQKGSVSYSVTETESVLTKWAALMRNAPEDLNTMVVAMPGFGPEPTPMLMILFCCADDEGQGAEIVKPLLELGTPLQQTVERVPYYKMLEDVHMPPGMKTAAHNGFVKKIDEQFIKAMAANTGRAGTPIVQIRAIGGQMAHIGPDATAFVHRDFEAVVWVVTLMPATTTQEQTDKLSQRMWAPFKPFTEGAYINFSTDVYPETVAAAYPPATYQRLARVKAIYDPENVFNQTMNIKPDLA